MEKIFTFLCRFLSLRGFIDLFPDFVFSFSVSIYIRSPSSVVFIGMKRV